jgi:S-DNA-T family DNA segregation ATPase FtsK/SpoIIIE
MSTLLVNPTVSAPSAAAAGASERVQAQVWRARLVRARAAMVRRLIAGWRLTLTLYAVLRLGLLWRKFCAETGLAKQSGGWHSESGRFIQRIDLVPRIRTTGMTGHGWVHVVRLRPGQDLDTYVKVCGPLRHAARVETVKAVGIPDRPGFVELRVLRRDPLDRVIERPRPDGPARMIVGADERGGLFVLDFRTHPHLLACGGTGSGKSGTINCVQAAIAQTDALMISWDLKWGIEAEAWRPRLTEIATTQAECHASTGRVLALAEARAALFRQLGVRSIDEAAELGVVLRRVFLIVDEVAEIAMDHGEKGEDGKTKLVDLIQPELLSIVQRVRAFGIHVILCGQRFGSDTGAKITAIRAQIPGRLCLAVNDLQTAEMVLPGMDREVHQRVLSIVRPGMGVVIDGAQDWRYVRSAFLSPAEVRAFATSTAHQRIGWDDLAAADRNAASPHISKSVDQYASTSVEGRVS